MINRIHRESEGGVGSPLPQIFFTLRDEGCERIPVRVIVVLAKENVPNPVVSKIAVNNPDKYMI
ncbi:MAG: hypothetical protein JWP06_349 [Candidatus Saccharibacteria bacterium]|nr:hypothetical protein [Candidatus Saccharibacteria bacterium]